MEQQQRNRILAQLAEGLTRRRLAAPARIALDMITPLGFLAGQLALFSQPLVPAGRWREYVAALSDEQGWRALRQLLEQRDC